MLVWRSRRIHKRAFRRGSAWTRRHEWPSANHWCQHRARPIISRESNRFVCRSTLSLTTILTFRTFAVLLQGSTESSCDDWLWIVSLAMIAGFFSLSICIVMLYCWSPSIRAFVGGFRGKRITELVVQQSKLHNQNA